MDAKIEILKYLYEKKDNIVMIDLLALVKSLSVDPMTLREVIKSLKKENLAIIRLGIDLGNTIGSSPTLLGCPTNLKGGRSVIGINSIKTITGRIKLDGEKYLQDYVYKQEPRIITNNVVIGDIIGSNVAQSSPSSSLSMKKSVSTKKATNGEENLLKTIIIDLCVALISGLILYFITK